MSDPMDLNKDGIITDEEKVQYAALKKQAEALGISINDLFNSQSSASATSKTESTESSSSTSSDVTIYSLNQVRNIATNAFENALGRMPTADELNAFVSSLNDFSKANPVKTIKTASGTTKSKDTTKSNAAGTNVTKTSEPVSTSTSSSTSSGGVDVSGFLQKQLENTAEARAVKVDDIFRGAMSFLADKIGG